MCISPESELVKSVSSPTASISSTLSQRQSSHGDFTENSLIIQLLKDICRDGKNWKTLAPPQQEAIDMICHKLGRILTGDPDFVDHWHDIGGYAKLVENILTTGKSHPSV